VIDSHQHYWRYDAAEYDWIDESMSVIQRDFLPASAACEMRALGISTAIAVQARQSLDETRWLLQLANEHQTIAAVVGWIDLQSDIDAQLAPFASNPKLTGVRHIVQAEPDGFLARPAFLEGIARLRRFGLTYDILVYARQLRDALAFAARFPDQPFVLDHLGKPNVRGGEMSRWRQDLQALAALPNMWCKLSGLVTEAEWKAWTADQLSPYLDAALNAFGPARVMMGSDWPVCLLAASYADVVGLIEDAVAEYSADEREQILGGNAARFYKVLPPEGGSYGVHR
jgi:L-fuconolactonase